MLSLSMLDSNWEVKRMLNVVCNHIDFQIQTAFKNEIIAFNFHFILKIVLDVKHSHYHFNKQS